MKTSHDRWQWFTLQHCHTATIAPRFLLEKTYPQLSLGFAWIHKLESLLIPIKSRKPTKHIHFEKHNGWWTKYIYILYMIRYNIYIYAQYIHMYIVYIYIYCTNIHHHPFWHHQITKNRLLQFLQFLHDLLDAADQRWRLVSELIQVYADDLPWCHGHPGTSLQR